MSKPRTADPPDPPEPARAPGAGAGGQRLSSQEIGLKLGLSDKTVKHYMTNILQKLHVRSRVEAALLGAKAGLTREEPGPR